jgi:hypothetical protein
MRGARGLNTSITGTDAQAEDQNHGLPVTGDLAEVARALDRAVQELRALRESLSNRQ